MFVCIEYTTLGEKYQEFYRIKYSFIFPIKEFLFSRKIQKTATSKVTVFMINYLVAFVSFSE